MIKVIVRFHESCIHIIVESAKHKKKLSMGFIVQTLGLNGVVMERINLMKKILPARPKMEIGKKLDTLVELIDNKFWYMLFSFALNH